MRPIFACITLAIAVAACAAAPLPPRHRTAPGPIGTPPKLPAKEGAARETARQLFSVFHGRIVEAEEHRSGPAYPVLSHITLYEQPKSSGIAGLCEVTAHDVGVPFASPPDEPPLHATWVRTSTRYLAIGRVDSSIPTADQESRCAGLPSATGFFTARDRSLALIALQTYGDAQRWAAERSRAAIVSCTSFDAPCADPHAAFAQLPAQSLASVEEVPCHAARSGNGTSCFRYHFRGAGPGSWSVNIKGPERPLHIELLQSPLPVS